jgi:hypothetical protein
MKYVSPVCEVEVLETKDIMAASTNVAGVTVFGDVDAVNHSQSGDFKVYETDEDGEIVKDNEGNPVVLGSGFGLSLDFSKLS